MTEGTVFLALGHQTRPGAQSSVHSLELCKTGFQAKRHPTVQGRLLSELKPAVAVDS